MPEALPVVAVLTAPGEDLPPGMDALEGEAELRHATDGASLRAVLPGTRVLCVTDFRTDALGEAWDAADSLEWIHATSAGVDAILTPTVRASNLPVTNARGVFDRPIAEFVLGHIIAFCKDFRGNLELQQRHEWRHRDTERVEGRRVLVVGAGAIGRQIARLCRAVGLEVDGMGRSARPGDEDFGAIHAQSELHQRLPGYDFVVVAAPLTPATEGLFDAAAFAAMAPEARFINIGRGPIVRTDDLVAALREGRIAGAALDVFEEEPLPSDHPLWDLPNTHLSAHMAGDVIGWRRSLSEQFIDNFRRWRRGDPLRNLVDKEQGFVPSS
ncbi:D-2-hydroxyacid dehydrogenase [Sediminicurvatus halobius]|uniref:D-2-hydroxyacid dehydrogenase n=1 Tax=Sediminicurvatus halobius TaxID=2182432 RepID=A0A2U2MZB0_9GAMM|nr:D-2-hydroxyacid dehydrogenase [Spiribacter halobius]PWG62152.1 D-2-hydroxyacid dehydrogenase [Spiribacter halobius]UEX77161.1 D-2-hydroxyacid dehydrogenase [Spiribacter halobius]